MLTLRNAKRIPEKYANSSSCDCVDVFLDALGGLTLHYVIIFWYRKNKLPNAKAGKNNNKMSRVMFELMHIS